MGDMEPVGMGGEPLASQCCSALSPKRFLSSSRWRTSRSVHSANYPCSLVPLSALREQEFAELVISVSLRLELAALEPFFAACFAATPATQLVYRCMGRAIASSLRRGRFTTDLLLALRELPYAQYMHPPPAANATEAIVEGMKLRDWVRPFVASASAVDARMISFRLSYASMRSPNSASPRSDATSSACTVPWK